MTEKLEAAVTAKGVPMLDNTQVIKIVSDGERVLGLLCLNTKAQSAEDRYLLVRCKNVVYATGGPAGIYADSVYPASQFGATGLALEAGVKGKNLTEWQYGLASTRPRWNVSGTYMQVLPRVYSAEPDGSDPREFLMDFFTTPGEMLSKLFLKGYQWPFDVRKVASGSSIIDILVYLESCKGRKVYLDYRTNPVDGNFRFEELDAEALDYLTRAGACFGTPIERLLHMNAPAVDFYRDKGVDLARRTAGNFPVRPAQQRRSRHRLLVADQPEGLLRRGRGCRQPRCLPSRRFRTERRTGGKHPCRPVYRRRRAERRNTRMPSSGRPPGL